MKQSKLSTIFIFLVAVLLIVAALAGCNGGGISGGNVEVSFGNGSSYAEGEAPQGGTYREGDVITLPECNFTRDGYVFAGWRGSDGKLYKSGDAYTIGKEAIKFTAEWSKTNLSVRFYDSDRSILYETTVPYGEGLPFGYVGADPTCPESGKEGYVNIWNDADGWSPAIPETFTEDMEFVPKFSLEKEVYKIWFSNAEGQKIKEYYYEYGDAIIAPDVIPEKAVPSTEPEVERYEFKGWKLSGEPDTTAVMPDKDGGIGRVANGFAEFVPVFEPVMKVYALTLDHEVEGAEIEISGAVEKDGKIVVTVRLLEGYEKSTPTATVSMGEGTNALNFVKISDREYQCVVNGVFANGVVFIAGVELNRYQPSVEESNAAVTGLLTEYRYGDAVCFTVTPDRHFDNAAPQVTVNGKAITGEKKTENGAVSYEYRIEKLTGELAVKAVGTINRYTVSLKHGDGSVTETVYDAKTTVQLPSSSEKQSDERYDYTFSGWEKDGESYLGNQKIEVVGNFIFEAKFERSDRLYTLTFLLKDGEKVVRTAIYEADFAAIAKDLEKSYRETEKTYTFSHWETDGATAEAGAVVTGDRTYTAVYDQTATEYSITFRYLSAGETIETAVSAVYGTAYGAISFPEADNLESEGKYLVWLKDGAEVSFEETVAGDAVIYAEYRVFEYTVTFTNYYDKAGKLITVDANPQKIMWGEAATAPNYLTIYKTDDTVFTFTGWSAAFDSVKENLVVTGSYTSEARVYQVEFKDETGAEFIDFKGDKTYDSELSFRVKLGDEVDETAVKVMADGVEIFADAEGVYRVTVKKDVSLWFEGVGTKKLMVTLPQGETFTARALDQQPVEYGNAFRFTVEKKTAYDQADLKVTANGVEIVADIDGVYTIENVTENVTVEIPELPINTYRAAITKGDGVAEVLQSVEKVNYGGEAAFTVTLEKEYGRGGLKIDCAKAYETTNEGLTYTVTIQNVTEDFEIRFYAERNVYTVKVAGSNFTAEPNEAKITDGGKFETVITLDKNYARVAPTADFAGAGFEKVSDGVYRLIIDAVKDDLTITVTPILNVYNASVTAVNAVYAGDAAVEVVHGGTLELTFNAAVGYDRTTPEVTVSAGTAKLVKNGEGYLLTVVGAEDDFTVAITGIANTYSITTPSLENQTAGEYAFSGGATARHGEEYCFSVAVNVSRNQTAPKVTLDNGAELTPEKQEGDTYFYRVVMADDMIVSVETKLNEYIATFVYPDGTTQTVKLDYYNNALTSPEGAADVLYNDDGKSAATLTGWTSGGKSYPASFTGETVTEDKEFTATYVTRYFEAKIGEKKYFSFETAIEEAVEGDVIDLLKPGANAAFENASSTGALTFRSTDKKVYELKAGVTLRLPYGDGAYSDFASNDNRFNTSTSQFDFADNNETTYRYFKMVLPAGYTLNVYGEIQIGGILSSKSQGMQGHTTSYYAEMTVDGTLNVYGTLKTFGYVKGSGEVNAESGARVYSPFVVHDFKGGSATNALNKGSVSPFQIYSLPNIQPASYKIKYGATETGYAVLWTATPARYNQTEANVIMSADKEGDSILKLGANGWVEKTTSHITNKQGKREAKSQIILHGDVTDGVLSLKISMILSSITVTTEKYFMPISYLYDLVVAEDGNVTTSYKYKFLPGSSLTVREGGKLNVNGQVIFYTEFDGSKNTQTTAGYEYDKYSPNAKAAAKLVNNGTLTVLSGGALGARIEGGGEVAFDAAAAVSVTSQEGYSSGSSFSSKFNLAYEYTIAATGKVGGVDTAFEPGKSYRLS